MTETYRTLSRPLAGAAAAALMALTGWAAAQVSEEPLPRPYYEAEFMGRYVAPGRCTTDDVEDLLVLTGVGVQIGPVLCEQFGKMTWENDRLRVPLYACGIGAENVAERTLTLDRLTGGDLSVRSDAEPSHVPNEVMQRCGP